MSQVGSADVHPLKPSLVEWKPTRELSGKEVWLHLETFLGGMETFGVDTAAYAELSLETFLGGMETDEIGGKRLLRRDLETFLGGMETCAQAGEDRRKVVP